MQSTIADYEPFWTKEAKDYVLVRVEKTSHELKHCVIFNIRDRMATIIENEGIGIEVMKRMVEAGVPVVNELPK